jgi:hypothetical protein
LKGNIRNSTSIHIAFAWQKYELAAGGNSSSTCGGMARLHPGIFWGRFQKNQTQQLFVAFVLKNDELQHTGKMGKRQRECQRKCQIECQMNCLNIRQIQCQIKGQIECQKNIILLTYKFTSFSMSDRMLDQMPGRMTDYIAYKMPDAMEDRMPDKA